jgi:photosystem I subunit 10
MLWTSLIAEVPVTSGWSPLTGIVMVLCNVMAIALGKSTMKDVQAGPALPMPEMFGGMGWPALLATTSLGHVFGFGMIMILSSWNVL